MIQASRVYWILRPTPCVPISIHFSFHFLEKRHTIELCPRCRLEQARSMAIMLPEQAVLSCILGPVKLKYQLSRLANMVGWVLMEKVLGPSSGSLERSFK